MDNSKSKDKDPVIVPFETKEQRHKRALNERLEKEILRQAEKLKW